MTGWGRTARSPGGGPRRQLHRSRRGARIDRAGRRGSCRAAQPDRRHGWRRDDARARHLRRVLHARATGRGQVVDAAMTDGTALQLAGIHGLLARGLWSDRRGENLLDGAAPFYRTYRCADGRHVAVGCLEPEFYAAFLRVSGLPTTRSSHTSTTGRRGPRWPSGWRRCSPSGPATKWATLFAGRDSCVTPVLGSRRGGTSPPQRDARDVRRRRCRGDPARCSAEVPRHAVARAEAGAGGRRRHGGCPGRARGRQRSVRTPPRARRRGLRAGAAVARLERSRARLGLSDARALR